MAVELIGKERYTLIDIIDRVLDKGLVINADITVSIVGTEILGIKIKAAISSFETAMKYGLEFPFETQEKKSKREKIKRQKLRSAIRV